MRLQTLSCLMACIGTMLIASASHAAGVTVLYNDQTNEIANVLNDPTDLWVSPEDLTRLNGFVLKPEGACLDELCIPIKQSEDSKLFVRQGGQKWVNATELARLIQQPFVYDAKSSVWSFGAVPLARKPFLESAIAPDFELTDREGNLVRLSDLRGKKVFIVTWASW